MKRLIEKIKERGGTIGIIIIVLLVLLGPVVWGIVKFFMEMWKVSGREVIPFIKNIIAFQLVLFCGVSIMAGSIALLAKLKEFFKKSWVLIVCFLLMLVSFGFVLSVIELNFPFK